MALMWQISEVVLGEGSGLSLIVIQLSPCAPPPFFSPPFASISIYVLYYDYYFFKIFIYISERLKKESQGLVGWDDPIDVNEQKRVRDLLNWHFLCNVVIKIYRLLSRL